MKILSSLFYSVFFLFYLSDAQAMDWFNSSRKGYVDVGAGWVYQYKNNDTEVKQAGILPDHYTSSSKSSSLVTLGAGYSWMNYCNKWIPAVSAGLEYGYISPVTVSGKIEQFSNPQFDNYDYQYKASYQYLMAQGKLDIYRFDWFMPFLLIGAGNSWNRTSDYREKAVAGVTPRISPQFGSKTKSNFFYSLGGGFEMQLTKALMLDFTYRYYNFGKSETSNGAATFSRTNLTSKSYATVVGLDLRYLFG